MTALVRSAALTHFTELATACGLDARALVAGVGLPPRCLVDADLKVPAHLVGRLLETAAAQAQEPAFGLRMGARILELLSQPLSFVQSYAPRYEKLATVAQSLTAHQAYFLSNLIGPEVVRDFPLIPNQADFQFPQRNAADLTSQIGWYFFVGSAYAEDGQEYGIEMMFFRSSLVPPVLAATLGLTDVQNQIVELHFAIAKAGERHYQAKPIVISGIGLLTWLIRSLGGFPDGVAFAVLLMNLAAPTIDQYTLPRAFGAGRA